LGDDQLARLLAAVPDAEQASGREKLKRLRNRPLLEMMALHALRTIEVHRASVEASPRAATTRRCWSGAGPATGWFTCGQTRPSGCGLTWRSRGEVQRDEAGTPLFAALGNHRGGHRLTGRHIRSQVDGCLIQAGLKRPGLSNHALRHTAATLGYLHTGDLRAVQELLGHADPRMTSRYAHVVDMAKRNPALFIPVKVG
jgi:integrase